MNDRALCYLLSGAAILSAAVCGAAVTAAIQAGGSNDSQRLLYSLAALFSLGLAVVFLSYAPAGSFHLSRARPEAGPEHRRALVSTLVRDGRWQIILGLLLVAIGTYFIFDYDDSNRPTQDLGAVLPAFLGLALIMNALASDASESRRRLQSRDLRRIRAANERATRASARAGGAVTEAERLERVRAERARRAAASAAGQTDDELREAIEQARLSADRAEGLAAEADALERDAEEGAAALQRLTAEAGAAARKAEADLAKALATMQRVERSVQRSRRAPIADPPPAEADAPPTGAEPIEEDR